MTNVKEILIDELRDALVRTMERATSDATADVICASKDAARGNEYAKEFLIDGGPFAAIGAEVSSLTTKLFAALEQDDTKPCARKGFIGLDGALYTVTAYPDGRIEIDGCADDSRNH